MVFRKLPYCVRRLQPLTSKMLTLHVQRISARDAQRREPDLCASLKTVQYLVGGREAARNFYVRDKAIG